MRALQARGRTHKLTLSILAAGTRALAVAGRRGEARPPPGWPERELPATSRQNPQGRPLSPASTPPRRPEESNAIKDSVPRIPGNSCRSDGDFVEWAQKCYMT